MENGITRWMKRHKKDSEEVNLEDVAPMHPEAYPARHLKEKLDDRRDELQDIQDRSQSTGIPEGPGGF